jgi:hypothetical protein
MVAVVCVIVVFTDTFLFGFSVMYACSTGRKLRIAPVIFAFAILVTRFCLFAIVFGRSCETS